MNRCWIHRIAAVMAVAMAFSLNPGRASDEGAATEEEELQKLREEAQEEGAETDAEPEGRSPASGGSGQRNLSALNPEISFLGDISYEWANGPVQDRFLLRGAELSLQAPLDPYTRFKAYLAGHQEPAGLDFGTAPVDDHGEEISVSLEEAYLEWVALPLNSRLRLGKFRQQFGTLNRWHPHALPSTDSPWALNNVFGHEGLVGLGVGIDFQLPGFWADSNGLTLEITNADNEQAFAGEGFSDPSFLLRHTGFFDLGGGSYFELGLSALTGPNDPEGERDTRIGGIDVNYVWEPEGKGKYRGLEVRGEWIRSLFEEADGSLTGSSSWYAYLTWHFRRSWYAGLRYDDTELASARVGIDPGVPFTPGLGAKARTAYLTFWQSEFVRIRLQVQDADRDVAAAAGPVDDTRIWLQVTFAAGPHKHESY